MSGGFPDAPAWCQWGRSYTSYQGNNGEWTNIPTGTYPTFGAWTQVVASAPFDICELSLVAADGGNSRDGTVFQIGIGASGSEVVLVPAMVYSSSGVWQIRVPIDIPAGTRIAVRAAWTATINVQVGLAYFGASAYPEMSAKKLDSIGVNASLSQGTLLTSGASNVYGAYTQLIAATANDYAGFIPVADNVLNTATNDALDVKIAIGASGSEVDVFGMIAHSAYRVEGDGAGGYTGAGPVWIQIPAGTRISAKLSSPTASATVGVSLIGIGK